MDESIGYYTGNKKKIKEAKRGKPTTTKKHIFFAFQICSHSTKKLYRLLDHSQIHSTDKKFVCPVDGCGFSTNTADRLKFHKNKKVRLS